MADETAYPAKPSNMWAVGLNVGILNIAGDVSTRPFGGVGGVNLGYGAYVRKALGYATSLALAILVERLMAKIGIASPLDATLLFWM